MFIKRNQHFLLSTKKTSVLFHVNEINKLTIEYYGEKLVSLEEADSLTRNYPYIQGTSISYSGEKKNYCLDLIKLAYSTLGKGDFYQPSLILKNKESSVFDFIFLSCEKREIVPFSILPFPHGHLYSFCTNPCNVTSISIGFKSKAYFPLETS